MKDISTGQGYYFNDNRASGGVLVESDIIACMHCETPMNKQLWRVDGAFCHQCNGPICVRPVCYNKPCQHGERNFTRRLEQAVELAYRRQQNAKVLGI